MSITETPTIVVVTSDPDGSADASLITDDGVYDLGSWIVDDDVADGPEALILDPVRGEGRLDPGASYDEWLAGIYQLADEMQGALDDLTALDFDDPLLDELGWVDDLLDDLADTDVAEIVAGVELPRFTAEQIAVTPGLAPRPPVRQSAVRRALLR